MRRWIVLGAALAVFALGARCEKNSAAPTPTAEPTAATRLEKAPIDDAQIETVVADDFEHGIATYSYSVAVTSGLPSGCHTFDSAAMTRNGFTIDIDVENRAPTGDRPCTAIYGSHLSTIELDPGLPPGLYTVHVNDKTVTFTAD